MVFQNGSQIYLGNDNCIRSIQIWVGVCIGSYRMMSFCDDLWSDLRCRSLISSGIRTLRRVSAPSS